MAYSQPKKQTITNDMIEVLNAFVTAAKVPIPFEKASLARDIEKVKAVDIVDYYDLLGMLGAICQDLEACRTSHLQAIKISGGNPYYVVHYAVSLDNFLLFTESVALLLELSSKDQPDFEVIDVLIKSLRHLGRYEEAVDWIKFSNRVFPDAQNEDRSDLEDSVLPCISRLGIHEKQIQDVFARAYDLARGRKVKVSDIILRLPDENEEDSGFSMIIYANESIESIADHIDAHCENEALVADHSLANKVMVSFAPS